MDNAVFLALVVGGSVGVPLYRARHDEPWRIAVALGGGVAVAGVMVLILTWAGTDLGHLNLLLWPAVAVAFVATFAIALRLSRRRRAAPPARSPHDLS